MPITIRNIGIRFCLALVLFAAVGLLSRTSTPADAFPGLNGKIAFESTRDGSDNIYVMNADGSGQTQLTNSPALDRDPDWSPDGSKIAFGSYRDGNGEVYVMNADGSGQTNVTNNPGVDDRPAWSGDSNKIVFESDRDDPNPLGCSFCNFEIYVMNANGSGQTRLTTNPARDDFPDWSPDGSKIVFTSDRDGNAEIYVMFADGSGQINITNNPAFDAQAAWSPDSHKIAFGSTRDGNYEIYVTDGSSTTRLTTNLAFDGAPAWQPLLPVSGDFNCDGVITVADAIDIQLWIAGQPANGCVSPAGDVNCDGVINVADAIDIQRWIAGLPIGLPPGCPA